MVITKANISGSLTDKKLCASHVPCHQNGKRIFGAVFIALILLTGVAGAYSGGDGSADSAYLISNRADLIALSTDSGNWTQNFTLTADINLAAGSPASPVGNGVTPFTGNFDGKGHTISCFEMDKSNVDNIGLFGRLGTGGNITDLGIEAGAEGVRGKSGVGVLVGLNDGGSVTNCSATGITTADYSVGGLVGVNDGGSITNCSATGSATATANNAGGLVGFNYGSITNCSAADNATAAGNCAGGLVGASSGGSLENCYATGNVTATGDCAGGLVGTGVSDSLENCYATGSTTATNYAGGLVGFSSGDSLRNCYVTGSATATDAHAGGLVGVNIGGSITNCYYYYDGSGATGEGTPISDITKFRDYAFLTGTEVNDGLRWSPDIISTDADPAKIWRAFTWKCHDPIFQSQSVETGTLQVNSTPAGATVSFNGVSTGEITNHVFSEQPVGVYNVTVQHADYIFVPEYREVTLTGSEPELLEFTQLYSGGEGTAVRPYEISNSDDLIYLSTDSDNWDKNFTVTADIDLAVGSPTSTIGNESIPFTGSFDGQEYTISNFEMNKPNDDNIGLFGRLGNGGNITDLGIEAGAGGVSGSRYVGVLVGCSYSDSTIENCYATGNATATSSLAGGLVGGTWGTITNCYATGDAGADQYVGGLVGGNDGTLTNCYATGNATAGDNYAGGLVGINKNTLKNCYATGTADAGVSAGGLVGDNCGFITNCYRYVDGGTSFGTHISDRTKFRDYAFLTGTEVNDGLNWSTDIISTDADSSKIWRAFTWKCHDPIFQWQSVETGTLQVDSNPAGAAITLNGVDAGEVTNTLFLDVPAGEYTITVEKAGYITPAGKTITVEKDGVADVFFRLRYEIGERDDVDPFVVPTPAVTPTATPVPTTETPTVTPLNEFSGTAKLPVGPGGAVERTVTLWAEDQSGYLTIGAGVVARDASGRPVENITIVAVPLESIPSPGDIWTAEHPQALYAYSCTPEGVTFSPAINLTFTLSEEEWDLFGSRAEVGWFNSTAGAWEIITGVPDESLRTITIQASHFSIYALFADAVPVVALPDVTGMPAGSSDGSSLWLWGGFFIVVIAAGGIFCIMRGKEE